MWSIILGSYFLLVQLAQARDPAPVLLPSGGWYVTRSYFVAVDVNTQDRTGSDGNWSTISFSLGSNSQAIEVLVSTALSEFWAIGPGGCLPSMFSSLGRSFFSLASQTQGVIDTFLLWVCH
jgi:hypothetical protein